MQREQCKVGMEVTFGRTDGEKTRGIVLKCNPKRAKIKQLGQRLSHGEGTIWNVPYSLIHADGVAEPAKLGAYPIGLAVAGVRYLTAAERASEGWESETVVAVVLSDGSLIYASRDYEGNGPGALFGKDRHGATFWLTPSEAGVV